MGVALTLERRKYRTWVDAVVYSSRAEPFHASVSEMPAARALSRAAPVPQPALGFGSLVLDRAVDSPKLKRDCRESSASSRDFSGAVLDAPTRVMATSDRHWNSRSRNAGSAISSTDPAESGRPSASRPLVSGSKSGSDSAASPAVSLRLNANNHRAVCQRKLYRPYDSSSAK